MNSDLVKAVESLLNAPGVYDYDIPGPVQTAIAEIRIAYNKFAGTNPDAVEPTHEGEVNG